jgi:alkylhydroperoxidase family enzyme
VVVNERVDPAPTAASELARLERSRPAHRPAANPRLRPFFECWLDTFIFQGEVDPRLREQAILRVLWRCGRRYEWGNHYRLARQAGLSDDDVLAVRTTRPDRDLAGDVAVVVRAADDVVDAGRVSPQCLAAIERLFPDPALQQEFLYLVAGYRMFATVSASTPESDDGPLWPPDGIGPESRG